MKEDNTYSAFNDVETGMMVSEPAIGAGYATPHVKERASTIPDGVPHSVDTALTDIDEGEREFKQGQTYSHKAVMQMIWERIDCYAG